MRVAVCSLLLLATLASAGNYRLSASLASAGRYDVANDRAIIEDIASPQDARVVRVSEGAAAAPSDASEEVVDVRIEAGDNGEMRMEFTSHGRKHDLKLVKSRVQLENVPVRFLGSEDDHDESIDRARKVTLMVDRKHGATIAVKSDDDGNIQPVLHSGLFKLGDFEFNVAPHSDGKVKVSKRSVAQPIFDHDAIERTVEEKTRQARSDPSPTHEYEAMHINCELAVVADYSMYMMFQELPAPVGLGVMTNDEELLIYFAHLVSAMDITYGSIVNNLLTAEVSLAGITVFTTNETQPQIVEELTYEVDGVTYVDGSSVLNSLSSTRFYDLDNTVFPPSDHVMLFSNYDLTTSGSPGLLGVAYLSGVCFASVAVSVVEARQTLGFVAVVAIHELGHNLAMYHDEEGPSGQCADENFIMSPYAGNPGNLQNRFLFSCCGQRAMYWRLRQPNHVCLQNSTSEWNNIFVDISVGSYLPGQVYDEDDQCYLALGTPACDDSYYATVGESKCLNLYCVDPDDSMNCIAYSAAALDGTSCDESDGVCYQGQCTPAMSIPTMSSHTCDVFDCYGNEKRCKTGVSKGGYMGLCYPKNWHCDKIVDCVDESDEDPRECKCIDKKRVRNKCYTIRKKCQRAKLSSKQRRECRRRCKKNRKNCCKTCCGILGLCNDGP